jgi:hypothetical protein
MIEREKSVSLRGLSKKTQMKCDICCLAQLTHVRERERKWQKRNIII